MDLKQKCDGSMSIIPIPSLKVSDLFYYFALLHGIFSGKTEYQTTKTNKARRSASFERRPSKRYSRRTLQMKGKRTSVLRSIIQCEDQVIISFKNSGQEFCHCLLLFWIFKIRFSLIHLRDLMYLSEKLVSKPACLAGKTSMKITQQVLV